MRNSATAGDIKLAHTRRISKVSIFCDHGHEREARTRWTLVDMRNVGIVNGSECSLSERKTAFRAAKKKKNSR